MELEAVKRELAQVEADEVDQEQTALEEEWYVTCFHTHFNRPSVKHKLCMCVALPEHG